MWKLLLNLILILQSSINSVPSKLVLQIELKCELVTPNPYIEDLNCYFLDVSSSNEQLNVTSIGYDLESVEKTLNVMIVGNVNYPVHFPKNLDKIIAGTTMFSYNKTPLKFISHSDFAEMAENLSYIDLEGNETDELPYDIFYDMPELSYVHLDHNNIKSLAPNLFANSPALETFHIESNKIKELHPDLFKNSPKLATIYADFNEVEEVHDDLFKHNPNIFSIHFKNNKIRKIKVDFRKFETLNSAIFLRNQGLCDIMYLGYEPFEGFYSDNEIQKLVKNVPEFQMKIAKVCKG